MEKRSRWSWMRITSESKTGYFTVITVVCAFLLLCSDAAAESVCEWGNWWCLMFRLHELKAEGQSVTSTSVSTPQPVSNIVHYLAQALAQIEQGIERKFLKAPLGKIYLALASIETLRVWHIYLYKGVFLKMIAFWRVCSCMDDCFVFRIVFLFF